MALRIAVGQIASESNHFVAGTCGLAFFRQTGYALEGDALWQLLGTDSEVAGMLAVLKQASGVEIVPLLAARANSSGPLSSACYATLTAGLLDRLASAGPIDGVLLSHHGSMAAEGEDDPEGDIAARVRALVDPAVPLVMTLDLHGNVTPRMVENATAILGYETYPHRDARATGERAATLLLRTLRREIRPVMRMAKLPMILTAFHASTDSDGPFAQLMHAAKGWERVPGILSTSVFLVGSYLDVPDLGCCALAIADGDALQAEATARALAAQFWQARQAFAVDAIGVAEAVRRGRAIAGGPVLLLDTADTTGGGACGDGIGLVRELLAAGVTERALATVVDPGAAATCHVQGVGHEITLPLGHALDPTWGVPLRVTGVVTHVSDGQFTYTGGILGGSSASMGPSAVLRIGSVEVLITSTPTYEWADEQYRAVGLSPSSAKFVGVKNMMNFRFGYRDTMKGYFVLNLPGPTPADLRQLPFRRISRPIFPLDEDCPPTLHGFGPHDTSIDGPGKTGPTGADRVPTAPAWRGECEFTRQ